MDIQATLKSILSKHKEKITTYHKQFDFNDLAKDYVIANYITTHVSFSPSANTTDWLVIEMINNENDVLLVDNQNDLNVFRDVNNPIYKDIPVDVIKSITERIFVSNGSLESTYTAKNYKVIIKDYTNSQYKVNFTKWLAKYFPDVEIVLGIN